MKDTEFEAEAACSSERKCYDTLQMIFLSCCREKMLLAKQLVMFQCHNHEGYGGDIQISVGIQMTEQ